MRHDPTDHAASSKLSHPDHAINTLGEEVNPLVTGTEDDLDSRSKRASVRGLATRGGAFPGRASELAHST